MTVSVTSTTSGGLNVYEITSSNGWGVRVPRYSGQSFGANLAPAPVQAIRRRSGTWSTVNNGTNLATIKDMADSYGNALSTGYAISSVTTAVQESGRLRAIVTLTYTFQRATFATPLWDRFGSRYTVLNGTGYAASTAGTVSTITVNANPTGGVGVNWPQATDGSDWPTADGVTILINGVTKEIMKVTGGWGTSTLNVIRGYNLTAGTNVPASSGASDQIAVAYHAASTSNDGFYTCQITVEDALPLIRYLEHSNGLVNYNVRFEEGISADTMVSFGHNTPPMGAGITPAYVQANCIQKVVVDPTVTKFQLAWSTYGNTADITVPASGLLDATAIQSALGALGGPTPPLSGNIAVFVDPSNPLTAYVPFRRSLGASWQPPLSATVTGGTGSATCSYVDQADTYQVVFQGSGVDPSGTFTLKFNGVATLGIAFSTDVNTLASNVQSKLAAVTGVKSVVAVGAPSGNQGSPTVPASHAYGIWVLVQSTSPGTTHGLTAGTAPTNGTINVSNQLFGTGNTSVTLDPAGSGNSQGGYYSDYLALTALDFSGTVNHEGLQPWNCFGGPTARFFYQASGSPSLSQDAIGLFAGRASLGLWGDTQVTAYNFPPAQVTPVSAPGPALSAAVSVGRGAPQFYPYLDEGRLEWCLYLGVVDDMSAPNLDYANWTLTRRITQATGFTLTQTSQWSGSASPPTPPGSWGGTFQPEADFAAVLRKIATGAAPPSGLPFTPSPNNYYGYLYQSGAVDRRLLDALTKGGTDYTGGGDYRTAYNGNSPGLLPYFYQQFLKLTYQMWQGVGSTWVGNGINFNASVTGPPALINWSLGRALLAYDDAGYWATPLPAADRLKIQQALLVYAQIFDSNDWCPLQTGVIVNLGTANQAIQVGSFRTYSALIFPTLFAATAAAAPAQVLNALDTAVDANGCTIEAAGYLSTSLETIGMNLLQLKQGGTDNFASQARLPLLGSLLANFVTPATARLHNRRILVGYGDSFEDDALSFLLGLFASGLKDANPTLAGQLIALWRALGAQHNTFFGSTLEMIDDALAGGAVTLGSYANPGGFLCQRYGYGTANESMVWLLCGPTYADHRHVDAGHLTAWFLGCPLLPDWGTFYQPHTAAASVHSIVVPQSVLSQAWNADLPGTTVLPQTDSVSGTPPDTLALPTSPTQTLFLNFPSGSCATVTHTINAGSGYTWQRRVRTLWWNTSNPVMLVEDTFSGTDAGVAKVCSFNLVATGSVTTSANTGTTSYAPIVYLYDGGNNQKFPAGGTTQTTDASGGPYHFAFTGPLWAGSTSSSISCDVYTLEASQSWFVGGWCHTTGGQNAQTYYNAAGNTQTAFAETYLKTGRLYTSDPGGSTRLFADTYREQAHIFRRLGSGSFSTLFCPYVQASGAHWTVTQPAAGHLNLAAATEALDLFANYATYTNGASISAIATHTNTSTVLSGYGISIQNGECECTVNQSGPTATATVHAAANRTVSLTLPAKAGGGSWVAGTPGTGLSVSGTSPNFTLTYAAATANGPASVTFS